SANCRWPMRTFALILIATLCFAAAEPIVSLNSLKLVESAINEKIRYNINDPYDLLGTSRGTYVQGYGAVFTFEVNLVPVSPLNLSPFKPTITAEEIAALHDRKVKKMPALKEVMKDLMVNASKSLPGLPDNERIMMEAFLFNYRWENARGLDHRIVISAGKKD